MSSAVIDDDVEIYPYELVICVKRANVTGGGLPNSSYVEIYIDGNINNNYFVISSTYIRLSG